MTLGAQQVDFRVYTQSMPKNRTESNGRRLQSGQAEGNRFALGISTGGISDDCASLVDSPDFRLFGALRNHFGGCAGSEGSTLRGVFFQKDRVYR